jgi:glycine betaine/choline ABC-type transport system substrate-binding protein
MRGWSVVVSAQLAERLPDLTFSALTAVVEESGESLRVTVPRALGSEALQATLSTYRLEDRVAAVDWTDSPEEAEALLKFGVADMAIVDNLDETLSSAGFAVIEDDLGALRSTPIMIVMQATLIRRYPDLGDVFSDLGKRLTTSALHDLISRARLLHQLPEAVAREFLEQESLLAD